MQGLFRHMRCSSLDVKALRTHYSEELVAVLAKLLAKRFPSFKGIRVIHATEITQREMMGFLWKAHRDKFIADGHLDLVVSINNVLDALQRSNELLTATVTTRYSDYLLWLDSDKEEIIAVFPDAKRFV